MVKTKYLVSLKYKKKNLVGWHYKKSAAIKSRDRLIRARRKGNLPKSAKVRVYKI